MSTGNTDTSTLLRAHVVFTHADDGNFPRGGLVRAQVDTRH